MSLSLFNDDENSFGKDPLSVSNLLFSHEDDEEMNNIYPKPFEEDTENFKFNKPSQISPETPQTLSPIYINNETFINYFMHIDYNTPLNNNIIEKNNSSKSESDTPKKETDDSNEIKNETLLKKTKREKIKENNNNNMNYIKDNLTGIIYYEKDDPIKFRKAKKRIQNRESALRMKKLRENNMNKLDEEMNRLKEDNFRLINENISLKKEKIFLIDQIKFMQKIIKESNLEFKLKSIDKNIFKIYGNNNNENKNNMTYINITKPKEPILYYDGSKQKIKGKLFNVFVVCILSLIYIVGECNFDSNNKNDNNTINEHSIHLNSIENNDKKIKNHIWYYLSKIILFIIFGFIMQWITTLFRKIKDFFKGVRRKKKFI